MTTTEYKHDPNIPVFYNTAIIKSGFNEISGNKIRIASWDQYEKTDMIRIITEDGKSMLIHSSNIILLN